MDLRQLRYFVAIAEEASLSAAARRLNVAQPALTAHVQRLEQEVGVPLLLRTSRGVRPTESGALLAGEARAILRQVDELRETLRRQAASPRGQAAVGIPTTLAPILTVPLIEAVTSRFPEISLRIVEGLSGHMVEWLQSGRVDFALVLDIGASSGLAVERIAREDLFLIGPPGDRIIAAASTHPGTVPFATVRDLPLILPGVPHRLRDEVEGAARACGFALRIAVELDSLSNILSAVGRGAGYTILSLRVAHDDVAAGRVQAAQLIAPRIERTIYLAHGDGRPLGAAAAHVRMLARSLLGAMISGGRWNSETAWLARCGARERERPAPPPDGGAEC